MVPLPLLLRPDPVHKWDECEHPSAGWHTLREDHKHQLGGCLQVSHHHTPADGLWQWGKCSISRGNSHPSFMRWTETLKCLKVSDSGPSSNMFELDFHPVTPEGQKLHSTAASFIQDLQAAFFLTEIYTVSGFKKHTIQPQQLSGQKWSTRYKLVSFTLYNKKHLETSFMCHKTFLPGFFCLCCRLRHVDVHQEV